MTCCALRAGDVWTVGEVAFVVGRSDRSLGLVALRVRCQDDINIQRLQRDVPCFTALNSYEPVKEVGLCRLTFFPLARFLG